MGIFNITESEKKKILNLHNSARIIKEQSTPPTDDKSKIMAIQTALIKKYGASLGNTGPNGDGVDGNLGPKTLGALSAAMKSITSNAKTPPPATGTPAAGAPATGTPATGTPATGTPATGTPTRRDQRRERQDMRRSNRRQMQDLRAQQNANR